ncbi:cytochrome P450 [Roridomyces roridus]|uniref:Cytochrome P450 n=1 Tax=Roridomyces roridus TaxID=1738132 RepID=A0AAD7BS22_9AGAR|nr:cytochrome P450 [Roridomyces roridus]
MEAPSLQNIALAGIVLILGTFFVKRRTGPPLPPGPRGLPLLGNILQIPKTASRFELPSTIPSQLTVKKKTQHLSTYFRQLCEEYGGFVSLNLVGFPIVLIGNMKLAKEILEKRSAHFSARPLVPYSLHYDPAQMYWIAVSGQTHFIARKLSAGIMSGVRAGDTELLQQFEALISVKRLLENRGDHWFHEMERTAASMVLTATFGQHCPTGDEPELKEVVACVKELGALVAPGASIINAFPFLNILPGPMPWRTRAAAFRKREDALYDKLVTEAVSGKASGMNTWAAIFTSEDKPEGDQRRLLNIFASAAIETTSSTMQTFVLACVLSSSSLSSASWVARAQKELDTVVGADRLPTFKDRPFLPFIEAVMRETLRWRPSVRFVLPHNSTADEIVEYNGKEYFIQKGTVVFAVTWAIEHAQDLENRDTFNPERFLDADGQLKAGYETAAFGFGRRACPGMPFAERSLWITIALILWSFNVRKSLKPDPKTGLPFSYSAQDEAFHGDLSNGPIEFPAIFEPRSEHHAEVVRQEWENCEKDLNVLLPQHKRR